MALLGPGRGLPALPQLLHYSTGAWLVPLSPRFPPPFVRLLRGFVPLPEQAIPYLSSPAPWQRAGNRSLPALTFQSSRKVVIGNSRPGRRLGLTLPSPHGLVLERSLGKAGQSPKPLHPAPCHGPHPFASLQEPSTRQWCWWVHPTPLCPTAPRDVLLSFRRRRARPSGRASHDPSPCSLPGPVIPLLFPSCVCLSPGSASSISFPRAPDASRSPRYKQHLPRSWFK